MQVRYIHESPLSGGCKQASNILWHSKFPMKQGQFPSDHPCTVNADGFKNFQSRGYWASLFPEGDGITLNLKNGQNREQVIRDIQECFGWEIVSDFNGEL